MPEAGMTSRTLGGLLLAAMVAVPLAHASQSQPSGNIAAKRANIYIVASKSFCLASGISDAYTGNGKVIFYFTLRNSGSTAGKVSIVPVRHYDDGEFNASALDMLVDVRVAARSVRRLRSPAYTYKAHEHEIESCGVKINNRREVRIPDIH
jgi:hypothetical protein